MGFLLFSAKHMCASVQQKVLFLCRENSWGSLFIVHATRIAHVAEDPMAARSEAEAAAAASAAKRRQW